MSDFNIKQRVIDTTRAFEKKYFGPKVDEDVDSSNLTTTQKAVIKVMLKEDFGCNQGKVRRLMAAVTGIDEGLLKKSDARDDDESLKLVRFLAVVDDDNDVCVVLSKKDSDGDFDFDCYNRDYLEAGWRLATTEEIEVWFVEFFKD